MDIVILDGHTLNPGDLSWGDFERMGKVTLFPRSSPEEIEARARGADVLLTNKVPLQAELIQRLPRLKYVGVTATGTDAVDQVALAKRGIPLTNVPGYGTASVAQTVFALLLELTHHVGDHARGVAAGHWANQPYFCYWESPLIELSGKTMGLVGQGRIAQQTAQIARAFGMKVMGCARPGSSPTGGIPLVPRDELFSRSDVVSLHCPLTEETRGMVFRDLLGQMKPSAFLINTARGKLVVEADLADALNGGALAGAGLDVLCDEPPKGDHPLFLAKNCLITPHLAWATRESRQRLMAECAANLRGYMDGKYRNVVNGVS
ncbi:MAG: D-2-hydroxyacid dehydrogenase [Spirochaetes bacterium]|nr:D-2-hydroxyacid dehydrogenase [Spirochaetota bacterium]